MEKIPEGIRKYAESVQAAAEKKADKVAEFVKGLQVYRGTQKARELPGMIRREATHLRELFGSAQARFRNEPMSETNQEILDDMEERYSSLLKDEATKEEFIPFWNTAMKKYDRDGNPVKLIMRLYEIVDSLETLREPNFADEIIQDVNTPSDGKQFERDLKGTSKWKIGDTSLVGADAKRLKEALTTIGLNENGWIRLQRFANQNMGVSYRFRRKTPTFRWGI